MSEDADNLQEELLRACPGISFSSLGAYDSALAGNCRLHKLPVVIPRLWHSMFEGFVLRDVAWQQKTNYGFYCRKDCNPVLMDILKDITALAVENGPGVLL